MIGQNKLRERFAKLISDYKIPRFTILVGPEGSGKTTLAKEIYNMLRGQYDSLLEFELPDVRIDTIREMIKMSYTVSTPTVFIISNADDMSVGAKNAILKITEEPPNNAYFIMTLNDLNNTLETIKSRGTVFTMLPYSKPEITEYVNTLTHLKEDKLKRVVAVADNPGEVRALLIDDVDELHDYVVKVIDNIAEVSGANAFKIANKVAIKADDEGYKMEMFFKMFQHECLNRMHDTEEKDRYLNGITITNNHLLNLNIRGANRQFVIDSWILEIRRTWM